MRDPSLLTWRVHKALPAWLQWIEFNGYSVIRPISTEAREMLEGATYEVQDLNGEIHQFRNEKEMLEYIGFTFDDLNWKSIAAAIELETLFRNWCGEHYELFDSGEFPGIGTPRAVFVKQQLGLENLDVGAQYPATKH